jgi:hypothetical protein
MPYGYVWYQSITVSVVAHQFKLIPDPCHRRQHMTADAVEARDNAHMHMPYVDMYVS